MRLKLPQDKVSLGPEDLARAKKEEEKLKEIWQQITPRLFQGDFMLPLPNPVSAVFGAKRIINDQTVSVHRGIDLRGNRENKSGRPTTAGPCLRKSSSSEVIPSL